ncbi:hypothetical protein [Microbacterium protaetiae]|uniref:hypothetical protein n=1 Tax=Microbacterium protaetiae TaxID=2509458 RepID=UPI001F5C7860|nr:hypothetical protein [Microbacterium protaetiae]
MQQAADRILAAVHDARRPNAVVLIDGRSGAGKSTLAGLVAARWGDSVQLVALDWLYPGWDGMDAGVQQIRRKVLEPHRRAERGAWSRWDWEQNAPAEQHDVDPALPLLIEGAGLVTPTTARCADVTVWLQSPATSRRRRALDRDGDAYRPHWERWATQERTHIVRDAPAALAQIVVDVP